MKKHILPAFKLTLFSILLLAIIYPFVVWSMARLAPNNGKGKVLTYNGVKHYTNIGQSFTDDKYFWSRPSAVDYNAAGSGGSNKGPSNDEYLATVHTRIDNFLIHNPGVKKSDIPVDLITASGSGLDPNFSIQAAKVQVERIAKIRNLEANKLFHLIEQNIEKPLWGIFGPEKINVLKLNIELDKMSQ
ncbi:K(+)-transporting ATPase subunit C [Sphingobacterium bovistauri]|uniref:Potassium-transporting ATPase KdpC subunit n=1 Tax=Sphingobacterium bovistauri TaxID=2781959 RepID=A0ABS7Z5X0_9SPHI|nr:K(+)-transporting ATPase subunit C [Sphingobacterium bovistauri]MCA5005555.1 K(+)-transporting ATPase subunit C [Sphingobacterium bovistauri]